MPQRIHLFTGKGGVGKTTLAAAAGLAAASAGRRVLLLSTDPAHSLSDVLGVPLGGEPTAVPGAARLFAAEVDVRASFEAAWSEIRDYLVGVLSARGIAEVAAEELVMLPGAEEVLALLEVERFSRSDDYEAIVVDCAPTGETLRLLTVPETLRFYVDRLFSAPQRMLRALAAGVTGRAAPRSDSSVRDAVTDLLDRLTAARVLLTGAGSGITVVTTPEQVVVAEARRAYTFLSLHGYRVASVVVNRMLPDDADGDWATRLRTAQAAQLAGVRESFAGLVVRTASWRLAEPVGVSALRDVADEVFSGADPLPEAAPDTALSVGGSDGRYTMSMWLPLADRGQLQLTRAGDDLVVTVGDQRRRIALPSLLQRCVAVGARFDSDALIVDFEPDPARWPALVGA